MSARRVATFAVLGAFATACAAQKPAPKSAASEAAAPAAAEAPASQYAQPSPAEYPQGGQPVTPGAGSGAGRSYAPPPPPVPETPGRQASRDFDVAERELLVAAGDCHNACRALGSMDRAAGRICTLDADDKARCDDATKKVRTARDRVKSSCGECKDTSTDPNAPVPSR